MSTNNTPILNTQQLQALKKDLQPGGKIAACIEAGFMKGTVNGQQAESLKQHLDYMLDCCQSQQETIFKLQAQLAQAQQIALSFS